MNINSNKWVETLPTNKWEETFPKKSGSISKTKYVITIFVFILSIISITLIKNETRSLQKEINNLEASIKVLKLDLHQETLDHEVITSPENLSQLAKEYLDINLVFYNKSQIRKLNRENVSFQILEKEKTSRKKTKNLTDEIKLQVAKQVIKKKKNLKKIKELYQKPENLPVEIKSQIATKIEKTKTSLKNLYNDPRGSIDKDRIQQWAVVQVVKVFLGIPVIPGR